MSIATIPYASRALSLGVDNGIAVITLDVPDESVNTLDQAVVEEFTALLDRVERDSTVSAVVFMSGKPENFIAGADIQQFTTINSANEGEALSRSGQAVMERIERLRTPMVAAIHGACLGGGLEMALACAYRIATDHPKTMLALPEVTLGVIPGAGGTQRLPRTVGLRNALDMILTGKNVRAKKALGMGLIDELVHPAILRDVAVDRARKIADGTIARAGRKRRSRGIANLALEGTPMGRRVVFNKARDGVVEKTHGHYPAPLAAIEAVRAGYDQGSERGFAEEARLFGEMSVTEVCKQLVYLFFATTALKKDNGVGVPLDPLPVDKIGILGAGFMGAGIASVAAGRGTVVRLKDADTARVAHGLRSVNEVLREQLVKKRITRREFEDEISLVGGTVDYSGFQNVDLLVEAVFEDLALKQQVLREAEEVVPGDAIYASNTSTIPITRIAEASKRPEQVLGMHFFSPVHKMPLLEVIVTVTTTAVATVTAVAYGKKLGKHVIVVNDGPGFYTTRTLAAFMNEAGHLLDEGVAIDALDKALVDFGFPVGPITLMDEVGLDVGAKVGQVLLEAFGERLSPAASLARAVAAGRVGRKGGKGFYLYDSPGGKKRGVDESVYELLPTGSNRVEVPVAEMQQRCVLAMVNEAARCLEEGILRSERDGDVGAVFGIGFPPFRGGPFRYVKTVGANNIIRQLELYHSRFAPRFEPARALVEMAEKGRGHSEPV
ncbi:MAG TPA: fatty acid oxidation complex subunit alpha FadJ [Gemmatimonadaceae bacterium]